MPEATARRGETILDGSERTAEEEEPIAGTDITLRVAPLAPKPARNRTSVQEPADDRSPVPGTRRLTSRQEEVLEAIRLYIRKHGMAPNRDELADKLGLADGASVTVHLKALVKKGHIEVVSGRARGIRVLDQAVPLIKPPAEVAAGNPIVCEEHTVERVAATIAERFRPRPDYLLTVRGDSMDRTGLHDGDIVAVRKTPTAETGDVVVARFGDEVTLKRFVRIDDRHVELRPESYNEAHKVMELDLAKHILHIEGVAVGALIGRLIDHGSSGLRG